MNNNVNGFEKSWIGRDALEDYLKYKDDEELECAKDLYKSYYKDIVNEFINSIEKVQKIYNFDMYNGEREYIAEKLANIFVSSQLDEELISRRNN